MRRPVPRLSRRTVLLGSAGLAGGIGSIGGAGSLTAREAAEGGQATLYKSPQCGCCDGYAEHLRDSGFAVKIIVTDEVTVMAEKYGIPGEHVPCHLSLIGGYVVGGHIPIAVVNRLLSEKPRIAGINLPGMPTGTPGMPGPDPGPLTIYEIGRKPPKIYRIV